MPPPPPPTLNKCCRRCSSSSSSPPTPPKLQRVAETRQKPLCTCLIIIIHPPVSSYYVGGALLSHLIDSRVLSRNRAGGGAARLPITRRSHAASLLLGLAGFAVVAQTPARADDESNGGGGEEGVLGAIKSIFDPNEKTKAGKVLPKAYLKAAREVVRTLRESLEEEDGGDMAKFRRNADAAKGSIREFLGGWRGQQAVVTEESYVALEKAIRSLAEFYSKAGPSAPLPQDVKNKILDDLSAADAYL